MDKIDPIKSIVDSSGHNLTFQVAEILRAKGWSVIIGSYFTDPATNKPRELDIKAERIFNLSSSSIAPANDSFRVRLFIECKHIPSSNVFWFDSKDMKEAEALVLNNPVMENWSRIYGDAPPSPVHHYLQGKEVVKQNAKAGQADLFYDALNGSLNALVCSLYHNASENRRIYTINFPVIVINSLENIFRNNPEDQKGYSSVMENVQWEVNYSFPLPDKGQKSQYFLLDIVSLNKLGDFLDQLDNNDFAIFRTAMIATIRDREWKKRKRPSSYGWSNKF